MSITHVIFTSSDNDLELRGVFLDIPKTFDEMWHDGIICQLKQNGIKGKLLCLLMDFLKNLQKELFWMVSSHHGLRWMQEFHSESILRPFLFLIYIKNLPKGLQYNPKLNGIRVYTSDIRMTCECIRVTYGWHKKTCEWGTMTFQKSLNRQHNGKWILNLILASKLKGYYLA